MNDRRNLKKRVEKLENCSGDNIPPIIVYESGTLPEAAENAWQEHPDAPAIILVPDNGRNDPSG